MLQASPERVPPPCTMVIFGASGDLTRRKLVPALYSLFNDRRLPPGFSVVGFARRGSQDEWRTQMRQACDNVTAASAGASGSTLRTSGARTIESDSLIAGSLSRASPSAR